MTDDVTPTEPDPNQTMIIGIDKDGNQVYQPGEDLSDVVQEAFQALSAKYRNAFYCISVQGLTATQAATVLESDPRTVLRLNHVAARRLNKKARELYFAKQEQSNVGQETTGD